MSATVVLLLTKCTASITKSLVPLVLAERVQHQQVSLAHCLPFLLELTNQLLSSVYLIVFLYVE